MDGVTKAFTLAVTAVSVAVIFVFAFAWFGPGLKGITQPAAASVLFDEELVQGIYNRVSPAVVELSVDRRNGESFTRAGSGSGFLIDSEGHIATNNHVIQGADRVRVSFQDGTTAVAEVLGTNRANDLALVKVDSSLVEGITPVELADSAQVSPGQLAVAIGSPFGLDGSITVGVISGVGRTLDSDLDRPIAGVLQTDALINPGNSGGPLLNSAGQALGINTAIQINPYGAFGPQDFGRRSIGFAVPVNTLMDLLPKLKAGQDIRPPWLGIGAVTLEPLMVEHLDLPVQRGVYVTEVMPDSPAAAAELVPSGRDRLGNPSRGGDIITAVDGVGVNSVSVLISELNRHLPGDEVTLGVVRDGAEINVDVTLGEWPEEQEPSQSRVFPLPEPDGRIIPRDPELPYIPGFPMPNLLPEYMDPRR